MTPHFHELIGGQFLEFPRIGIPVLPHEVRGLLQIQPLAVELLRLCCHIYSPGTKAERRVIARNKLEACDDGLPTTHQLVQTRASVW